MNRHDGLVAIMTGKFSLCYVLITVVCSELYSLVHCV